MGGQLFIMRLLQNKQGVFPIYQQRVFLQRLCVFFAELAIVLRFCKADKLTPFPSKQYCMDILLEIVFLLFVLI